MFAGLERVVKKSEEPAGRRRYGWAGFDEFRCSVFWGLILVGAAAREDFASNEFRLVLAHYQLAFLNRSRSQP
jgi:hypothetical protein